MVTPCPDFHGNRVVIFTRWILAKWEWNAKMRRYLIIDGLISWQKW